MFLGFATLAAAMGIVFEKSDRFSVALAERTIGGRKRDIASNEAVKVSSYNFIVSKLFEDTRAGTNRHGFILISWSAIEVCFVGES
jgi:hypothetical protein